MIINYVVISFLFCFRINFVFVKVTRKSAISTFCLLTKKAEPNVALLFSILLKLCVLCSLCVLCAYFEKYPLTKVLKL